MLTEMHPLAKKGKMIYVYAYILYFISHKKHLDFIAIHISNNKLELQL